MPVTLSGPVGAGGATIYGGLGAINSGLGALGLGGSPPPLFDPTRLMPSQPGPYIAHLYTNGLQFKRTLGSASGIRSLTGKPGLKMTLNGGYHPIVLDVAAMQPPANLLPDPNFEADNVLADVQANWTLGTPSEWALMTGVLDDQHSGRHAIKCTTTRLGPNSWNQVTSVAFAVVPGLTYSVSGWRKMGAGSKGSGYLRIEWFDSSGVSITFQDAQAGIDGAQAWSYFSAAFIAPANAVTAKMELLAGWWDGVTGTNAQTWFDDLRVAAGTSKDDPAQNGDIIQLTEQGDPTPNILYTGLIEEIFDDDQGARHQLLLTPLVAELADTDFSNQYLIAVDVAQMVRDAVNKTAHLRVQPETCGDTGVQGVYLFNGHCLDALNQAKLIAGPNFFWFVDATGLVWFQASSLANPPAATWKKGTDYAQPKRRRGIKAMKNRVVALGGFPAGQALPITALYSDLVSIGKYGKRNLDPPLVFPTVTDQATLNKIVNTYGGALNRELNTIELELTKFPLRLTLGLAGGLTARLFDPSADPIPQPMTGSGSYLGSLYVQDIEVDGLTQKVILNDAVIGSVKDLDFVIDRIIQAVSAVQQVYT